MTGADAGAATSEDAAAPTDADGAADPRLPMAATTAFGERVLAAWREGVLVPGRSSEAAVALAGIGESFAAWRLEPSDGGGPLTVRVLWRESGEIAQAIGKEVPALEQLPPGIGPVSIAQHPDADASPIGKPCIVTTHVPGRVLDPADWTPAHLAAHARLLAAMHRRSYPGRGELAADGDPLRALRRGPMSMVGEVDLAFGWWREHEPAVCADATNTVLMDAARAVCVSAQGAFDAAPDFVLAHGDLCATNIVWDEDAGDSPRPGYIDFEWAQVDDRARDLAIIGGAVRGGPWYVPLDADGLEAFLRTYVAASRALEPERPIDVDSLRARRDAWVAYERTAMLLHVTRRAAAGDALHRGVLPILRWTLAEHLGVRKADIA